MTTANHTTQLSETHKDDALIGPRLPLPAATVAVAACTVAHGIVCRRRIGGVTGDTLGALTETAEALVLVVAVALG